MTWFRDQVYFPLGGSRGGNARTLANVLLVMTLAGLWHGANVTFVVWGFVSGLLLVLHRLFARACSGTWLERTLTSSAGTLIRIATTFLLIAVSSVFFRAQTLSLAGTLLQRLFVPGGGTAAPNALVGLECGLAVALGHVLWRAGLPQRVRRLPPVLQGIVYASALTVALALAPATGKTFVYFQF